MGGFFAKGVEGHVMNGMPWPFQNGLFCASFFHFFVHDQKGPIGKILRDYVAPESIRMGLDERTFATACISLFMQIMGILQMPRFLGPSFNPFGTILSPWKDSSTRVVGKKESEHSKLKKKEE